jgi:general stress protein 26
MKRKTSASEEGGPRADRPEMPRSYGIKPANKGSGLMAWERVRERLAASRSYWVCTSRPDGRPHAMPVWGFWVDDCFYFGTDRRTRKARNLEANPAVTVHLESGDDVVIVEGEAAVVATETILARLDAPCREKYGMPASAGPGESVIYRVRPRRALAWTEADFPGGATRFHFNSRG